MNKRLLTAENACNDGRNNKLLNPQADFLLFKINYLENAKSRHPAAFALLEK
ncbi:hypothetical protein GTP45_08555 [Pseudoduganella sp. FT55W]|uniref:Uncharacterized protein n=1 Tax=Duganella rivi TaxID=2666083 RepID=A0A7X4KC00_9BURK|nr:hypothetical protein [Duganella rivi]MYM66878.1 hypothetical protein [Duganella rivi]